MKPNKQASMNLEATVHLLNAFKITTALFVTLPAAASCSEERVLKTEPSHSVESKANPIKVDAPQARRKTKPNTSSEEVEERRIASQLDAMQEAERFDNTRNFAMLARALSDPDREVKDAALQALTEKGAPQITHLIRRGLDDSEPEFRIEVLEALAGQGDAESLRRATLDPDEQVRERAAELLESAGDQREPTP